MRTIISAGRAPIGTFELIVDLGAQPLANSFLSRDELLRMEPTYPLPLLYCSNCHLVQIPPATSAHAIFSDYLYMSSYTRSWVDHARGLRGSSCRAV